MKKAIKKKTTNKPIKELIGYCGVDSGQILISDPCYIDSEWIKNTDPDFTKKGIKKYQGEFSYRGCCIATSGKLNNQLNFKKGHCGAGVAVPSGWGDGIYPVYAKYDKDGRVSEVIIKF